MASFVGNTAGFAESGYVVQSFYDMRSCQVLILYLCRVSSAVVQRYLQQILDAALVKDPQVQNAAVDILGFTIKQGLAHPLQVPFFFLLSYCC